MRSNLPVATGIVDDRTKALLEVYDRQGALPVENELIYRVDSVPAAALPTLAEQFQIFPYHDHELSETETRDRIRQSIRLHGLRGTIAGLRAAIRLAGGELIHFERPPGRIHWGAGVSKEARNVHIRKLRHFKFWEEPATATAKGVFYRRSFWGHKAYFHPKLDARRWLMKGVEVDRHGVRTDLSLKLRERSESGISTVEVRGRGTVGQGTYHGLRPTSRRRYLIRRDASKALHILRLARPYNEFAEIYPLAMIQAGEEIQDVAFDLMPEKRTEKIFTWGLSHLHEPFRPRFARFFMVVYLRDPARPLPAGVATTFHGRHRYGVPAHTLYLVVHIPGRRYPKNHGKWIGGFLIPADSRPDKRVRAAIDWAAAGRDRIFIDTHAHVPVTAGMGFEAGDGLIAGQLVRRR